ncbi:MAG TPA: phospholipase D family protein [Marinobacter sp.]|nr:phospholipase D family protein [Marinobacter sp.]
MASRRLLLLVAGVCVQLALAGCSTALKPVDHEPERPRAPVQGAFLSEQQHQHLADDSARSGFQLLDSGRDAFLVRAALIEAAEHYIDAQYYIWNNDVTGHYMAGRLAAAAERGVQVRLLLDDINAAGKEPLFSALDSHPNIQVRIFNPARSRGGLSRWLSLAIDFDRINRRMHNKTFIVDGHVGITGGRNIGDEYFDEHAELNFRDRDVMVLGPLATDMTTNFDAYWNSQWSYPLVRLYRMADHQQARTRLEQLIQDASTTPDIGVEPHRHAQAAQDYLRDWFETLVIAPGHLVFDPPLKDPDAATNTPQNSARALYELIDSAQSEILVESAYLTLTDDQLERLTQRRNPDLAVAALTNSLASNDLMPNHAGYARWRREMLEHGVALYELRPDAAGCQRWVDSPRACRDAVVSLHSKAVVFDRETLFIGSFNVNLRSIYLNGETVVVIHSPELAAMVADDIHYAMQPENSWQVMLDDNGRLVWHSTEGEVTREPATGFWRRFGSRLLSWLPIEKYL